MGTASPAPYLLMTPSLTSPTLVFLKNSKTASVYLSSDKSSPTVVFAGGAPAESPSPDTTFLRGVRHGDRRRGGYGRRSGRLWSGKSQGPHRYGICGRGGPRTPFWNFLRTTRAGCVGVGRVPPEDRGEDEEGEEGGPGLPWNVFFPLSFFSGRC